VHGNAVSTPYRVTLFKALKVSNTENQFKTTLSARDGEKLAVLGQVHIGVFSKFKCQIINFIPAERVNRKNMGMVLFSAVLPRKCLWNEVLLPTKIFFEFSLNLITIIYYLYSAHNVTCVVESLQLVEVGSYFIPILKIIESLVI
jgi:hypothetical protein